MTAPPTRIGAARSTSAWRHLRRLHAQGPQRDAGRRGPARRPRRSADPTSTAPATRDDAGQHVEGDRLDAGRALERVAVLDRRVVLDGESELASGRREAPATEPRDPSEVDAGADAVERHLLARWSDRPERRAERDVRLVELLDRPGLRGGLRLEVARAGAAMPVTVSVTASWTGAQPAVADHVDLVGRVQLEHDAIAHPDVEQLGQPPVDRDLVRRARPGRAPSSRW